MTELEELRLAYAECSRQRNELLNKLKEQAQRTWIGLTDEEIDALREKHSEGRGAGWRFNFKGFARAIESAHGIKENA